MNRGLGHWCNVSMVPEPSLEIPVVIFFYNDGKTLSTSKKPGPRKKHLRHSIHEKLKELLFLLDSCFVHCLPACYLIIFFKCVY